MTQEEKMFLTNLLKQITINPSAPDAGKTVDMVQSILKKLEVDKMDS